MGYGLMHHVAGIYNHDPYSKSLLTTVPTHACMHARMTHSAAMSHGCRRALAPRACMYRHYPWYMQYLVRAGSSMEHATIEQGPDSSHGCVFYTSVWLRALCLNVCVCVYIHTYIHTYIHIYIYIYIWFWILARGCDACMHP